MKGGISCIWGGYSYILWRKDIMNSSKHSFIFFKRECAYNLGLTGFLSHPKCSRDKRLDNSDGNEAIYNTKKILSIFLSK